MSTIDFYFGFASPYGFIAAMQIETIGRPVRWRPFLLGSVYKAVGRSPLQHALKRDYVLMVNEAGADVQAPPGPSAKAIE
jgi:2-hydroxychromene-2-carboxylate isomerase